MRDVLDDPKDAAIAHTIIVLADLLGLAVIAEGVETVEHHRFLQEHGCPAFQGYLFGRPDRWKPSSSGCWRADRAAAGLGRPPFHNSALDAARMIRIDLRENSGAGTEQKIDLVVRCQEPT